MKKAEHRVSAYLTDEELRQFDLQKTARGRITESAFIREMLGFDVRRPGAPKGPRQKKGKQTQSAKPKRAKKKKSSPSSDVESRALLLPFPD
jgi:hypothetical protein